MVWWVFPPLFFTFFVVVGGLVGVFIWPLKLSFCEVFWWLGGGFHAS